MLKAYGEPHPVYSGLLILGLLAKEPNTIILISDTMFDLLKVNLYETH